jgi:hypothetical protein
MEKGIIDVNKEYAIGYKYHDRDSNYKYFNRKFEIIVIKKSEPSTFILLMDNCDTRGGKWFPHLHKPNSKTKYYLGVFILNWNEVKNKFLECIVSEVGTEHKEDFKKALNKLLSPKLP